MVTGARADSGRPAVPAALTALEAWLHQLAGSVPDPELPALTLAELGVLRSVRILGPDRVEVRLTPTYTGCPAIGTMTADIERVLHDHGVLDVTVRPVLAPPWTTEDISDEGRRKLLEYGIAPPRGRRGAGPVTVPLGATRTVTAPAVRGGAPGADGNGGERAVADEGVAREGAGGEVASGARHGGAPGHGADGVAEGVCCPRCGSADTELLSRFSSTACLALHRCTACREPFDHFKEV